MKRFKTPLLRKLQSDLNISSSELYTQRRTFIKTASKIGLGIGILGVLPQACNWKNKTGKIAIIGGGLAGLSAAYFLQKQGLSATVFESSNRLGGRVKTQNFEGFPIELGAEFIDPSHTELLNLIEELKLELIDYDTDEIFQDLFYIDQTKFSYEQALAELKIKGAGRILNDLEVFPEYVESGNVHLWGIYDSISIETYFNAIELSETLKKILASAYETEFGLPIDKLSCMNFLTLFEPITEDFYLYGDLNKQFVVKGGNEKIIDKLKELISPQETYFQHELSSIKSLPDKFFELEFKTPDGMESKQFEKVIFALPYTVLRKVKMDIEISEVRKSAIKELSYGEKAKYFLSFNDSTWRNYEYTGSVFCDNIYHQSIDCTRLQDSKAKILRFLSSGEKSAEMFRNKELQKEILLELENQFEGISMTFKSEGPRVLWSEETQQSNAAFGVGQMAKFYGSELQDEGSVYFIGEHVSRVYQGTMNGAVETAGTIVDKILKQSEK